MLKEQQMTDSYNPKARERLTEIPRVIATFIPQRWEGRKRDYAVEVDVEDVREFDVTLAILEAGPEFNWEEAHHERDDLRLVVNAPQWIKEWSGPFEVYVESVEEFWQAIAREDERILAGLSEENSVVAALREELHALQSQKATENSLSSIGDRAFEQINRFNDLLIDFNKMLSALVKISRASDELSPQQTAINVISSLRTGSTRTNRYPPATEEAATELKP